MGIISQYRGLKKEVYYVSFGRLVTSLGSMIWPMMTLILSRKMMVDAERISWLLAAAMLIMAPAVYIGGKLADATSKKYTIIVMDLISVACFAACVFIPMSWTVIFLLFTGSLFQNMEQPVYHALISDKTLTADRDIAFSLQYLCVNLGLLLAPTVSGILFVNHLNIAFAINSVSILASSVLLLFGVRDTEPVQETGRESVYQQGRTGESVFSILHDNPLILLFVIVLGGYYAMYQMYIYLMPLDISAIQGDRGAFIYGTMTSVNCLVVVLFTPVVTSLLLGKPDTIRILGGISLLFIGFLLFFIFMRYVPAYYLTMIVMTLGEILAITAEGPYLSKRVPSTHRGRVTGAYTFIRTLLTSLVTLLAGAVYSEFGSKAAWIVMLILTAGLIAAAALMDRLDRKAYKNLYI